MDEIYTDPELRSSAHSDASVGSTGIISSISSYGSLEPPIFEITGGSPANKEAGQTENFQATFGQTDVPKDADGEINVKMGLLNVEDEQEGRRFSGFLFTI